MVTHCHEESKLVPADKVTVLAGEANAPGLETDGYDIFNIHMHGCEVAPHLFYPPGTSDPEADCISISPDPSTGQQCFCHKFKVAEKVNQGEFLYHTHTQSWHLNSAHLEWNVRTCAK